MLGCSKYTCIFFVKLPVSQGSAVDSGGVGGARAPPEIGGSEKGRSLISAYWSLAITTNTPGFEKAKYGADNKDNLVPDEA